MQNEPTNAALTFALSNYEAQCRLEDGVLRLRVTANPIRNQRAKLSLLKMQTTENGLEFWLEASNPPELPFREERNGLRQPSTDDYNLQNDRAHERLSLVEQEIREMQARLLN